MKIYFKYVGDWYPILKIVEVPKRNQVIISFIGNDDEHLTLHKKDDDTILRTHRSKNKPPHSWDKERVESARASGYRNPEQHGQYFIHENLRKAINTSGYHLVGRRIYLEYPSYPKNPLNTEKSIVVDAPSSSFMLSLYLSTSDYPKVSKLATIRTFLGDIVMDFNI